MWLEGQMGIDLKFKKTTFEELLGPFNEVELKHATP